MRSRYGIRRGGVRKTVWRQAEGYWILFSRAGDQMMFDPESEIFGGLDILFAIFALAAAWKFANEDSVAVES